MFMPFELAYLERTGHQGLLYAPSLIRSPLFAYWTALWIKITGNGDVGMVTGTAAAHGFWLLTLYYGISRLCNKRTALIVCLFWTLNPMMVSGYNLFGYPDVLFGFLVCAFLFAWWFMTRHPALISPVALFLIGGLGGLCYLTRSNFIIWLPFFIWDLKRASWGWRRSALVAAGFLFAFAFQLNQPSSPLFIVSLTTDATVPYASWLNYSVYSMKDLLSADALFSLLNKFRLNLIRFVIELPTLWWSGAFLALAIFSRDRFFRWVTVLFLWQVFIFSFLRYESLGSMNGRYYLWYAPFAIMAAVSWVLENKYKPVVKAAAAASLLIVTAHWGVIYSRTPRKIDHPSRKSISQWPELAYINSHVPSTARVATNVPMLVSWYSKRSAVGIPYQPEDLQRIDKNWPIDYLFLMNHRLGEMGNYPEWQAYLTGTKGVPLREFFDQLGFVLEHNFETGLLLRRKSFEAHPSGMLY